MDIIPRLEAVVRVLATPELHPLPWDVTPPPRPALLRLWGEMSWDDVGLVMAEWVLQNRIIPARDPAVIFEDLITQDQAGFTTLAGGARLVAPEGRIIAPGFDCDLSDWRDWVSYEADDFDVWMGVNPAPWAERLEQWIRVWSDGGDLRQDANEDAIFYVDLAPGSLHQMIVELDRDLRAFRALIHAWATRLVGPDMADALVEVFDERF